MYKRSFWMVLALIGVVFLSSFFGQMMVAGQLPSAYDPGLAIQDAFKTSDKPLLIEFYTDSCTACRAVTPMVHRTYDNRLKNDLTLVMVDVDNPANQGVAQLFGITTVPALFVFDHRHMKKEAIPYGDLGQPKTIEAAVRKALSRIQSRLNS